MANPAAFVNSVSQLFSSRIGEGSTQAQLTTELANNYAALQAEFSKDPQNQDTLCAAGIAVIVTTMLLAYGDH